MFNQNQNGSNLVMFELDCYYWYNICAKVFCLVYPVRSDFSHYSNLLTLDHVGHKPFYRSSYPFGKGIY
jgi:hypothetical protein